jgi:hypothetical protein
LHERPFQLGVAQAWVGAVILEVLATRQVNFGLVQISGSSLCPGHQKARARIPGPGAETLFELLPGTIEIIALEGELGVRQALLGKPVMATRVPASRAKNKAHNHQQKDSF